MLRLSVSSPVLYDNSTHRDPAYSDIPEEYDKCFGLTAIFDTANLNGSTEFVLEDTYFEDMESLEFVFDPIMCFSSEDISSEVMSPMQAASHCPGCNCNQLLNPDYMINLKQEPGRWIFSR